MRLQSSTDAVRLGLAVVLLAGAAGLIDWRLAAFLVLPGSLVLAWLWAADHGETGERDGTDELDPVEADVPAEERGRCPGCGRMLLDERSRCDYCTVDPEWRK